MDQQKSSEYTSHEFPHVVMIENYMSELKMVLPGPLVIYADNQSAGFLTTN